MSKELQTLIEWMQEDGKDFLTVDTIIAKAKELQLQEGWISVEESLPEDVVRVLMYCKELNGIQATGYIFKGTWSLPSGLKRCTVTHWMPLPNKPR